MSDPLDDALYYGDEEDGAYAVPDDDGTWHVYIDCNSGHWTEDGPSGVTRQEAIDAARNWCFENGIHMEED